MSYDPSLFQNAAGYYARFRPKYPRAMFDYLIARFALDGRSRVLDLGSGTLNASKPLAPSVGEIVAMDPDPGMFDVARTLAREAGNITLLQKGSEDLTPALGRFRLVVMGQSFHWMDRDQVLRDLVPMVEDEGGIALIAPAHGLVLSGNGPPQRNEPWVVVAETVIEKYAGPRTRHPRSNPAEPRHEPALQRSAFKIAEYHEFPNRHEFDAEDVIGRYYSMSGNLLAQLGARRGDFEAEMIRELRKLDPSGHFVDCTPTALLVGVKK